MGALPRPDLPPGSHRDLSDALHDLHHRAGWPSLRRLATDVGCSHTTVSTVFSSAKLPSWGTLELVVESMHGDTEDFHQLWLAASTPTTPDAGGPAPTLRIAGRRTELTAVRRHLETGIGLLLVTGEAGIGKTRLVTSAADSADTVVATGHCLPLSIEVPLLPVADALRQLLEVDDGQWFKEALAECPPFVATSLAPVLPELVVDSDPGTSDDFARHRMFTATASILDALAATRPLALWFEDLHWADGPSLDLLEHLATRRTAVPVVGTWRTEDDTTSPETLAWFMRVQRLSHVAQLEPPLLSREETAEQLALLGGGATAEQVDMIHARSQGRPLFTEHLAAHLDDDRALPRLLLDLLDRRLAGLEGDSWALTRLLGLAERPLSAVQLEQASGLPPERLTSELHELRERRLLRSGPGDTAELQHPLLAEATQRRLVPGEATHVHRRLAEVLGSDGTVSPAEVATHWQLAGDAPREVEWRVAAARDSAERYDWSQEAEHWLRVLALWPTDARTCGDPPVERATAYMAAIDALNQALQWDRAADMSAAAWTELGEVDDPTRAELLRRAADYRGEREGVQIGMALIQEALEVYRRLPPGSGLVGALNQQRILLRQLGQYEQAMVVARAAVDTAAALGDRRMHRQQLTSLAWYEGVGGDPAGAFKMLEDGRALVPAGADPLGDIQQAVNATDVLLLCGAGLDAVEAAAQPGLETARSWGIDSEAVMMLRQNLATARIRAGQVAAAAELIPIEPGQPPDLDRWTLHLAGATIDARRGRLEDAARCIDFLWREVVPTGEVDLESLCALADIHFWRGTPDDALAGLLHDLDAVVGSAPVRTVCEALLTAARIAAELADTPRGDPGLLDVLQDLHARAGDELRPGTADPHLRAHASTLEAELARLGHQETTEHWVRAASAWDRLARPHDAAYCRWRAAQLALREGQGTAAARLLKRAAIDAREHVPLSRAIAKTAAGAR